MVNLKDVLVTAVENEAHHRRGVLAGELVRARPENKEAILAEIEFQHWLADSCSDCQDES